MAGDGEPVLLRKDEGGIASLTLNRPSARNALSLELMSAICAEFSALREDASVKVVVLAGAGPGFCAGHDLREIRANNSRDFHRATFAKSHEVMTAILKSPKPVIARVHGIATAGGCQLVAACDLAVASSEARFATPGVNIGLFCSTPAVPLSRAVGRKAAMEMLLTGDLIDAERAREMGLVNRVVAPELLDAAVHELAGKIASKSALTLALGKEAFYRQAELPFDEAYDFASEVMVRNLEARDACEGIDAFIGKRQPHWENR